MCRSPYPTQRARLAGQVQSAQSPRSKPIIEADRDQTVPYFNLVGESPRAVQRAQKALGFALRQRRRGTRRTAGSNPFRSSNESQWEAAEDHFQIALRRPSPFPTASNRPRYAASVQ